MIRTISLAAALAVGLALPAFAADTAPEAPPAKAEAGHPAAAGSLFTQDQARVHLANLGYTSISELKKDQNGVWRGSATKDGKTRVVAVDIKGTVRN